MNILYLTNELNHADGVSAHLYNLINELKRNYRINISIICGGGNATDKFKNTGSDVIENQIFNHSARSLKNFASAILYMYKISGSKKIDIIHSHNHYATNIAYRSSKFSGVKTVQTVHGILPDTGRLKLLAGNNFIAVNDHVFKSVKVSCGKGKRVDLIYNGIDFKDNISKKNNDKMKFIAAARFEPGKGLETFIRAVGNLPEQFRSRAEFIIAGEGSLEKELMKLSNDISANIIFPGMIMDMRKMFDQTDVCIIPSESEGLPMTMLEAIASGNSIISSDFDGVESIITDGSEGLIFKKNDPYSLTEKLMSAIDDPGMMSRYSSALFKNAKTKFSISEMGQRHINFYKSII
jgi:glycosyltransferase involved in cell wall biosynthesis